MFFRFDSCSGLLIAISSKLQHQKQWRMNILKTAANGVFMWKKKKAIVSFNIVTLTKVSAILASLLMRFPINKMTLSPLINLNSFTYPKFFPCLHLESGHRLVSVINWNWNWKITGLKSAPCLECCPKIQKKEQKKPISLRSCKGLVSCKLSESEHWALFFFPKNFIWCRSCLHNWSTIQMHRIPLVKLT